MTVTTQSTAAVDAAITSRRAVRAFLPTPVLRETIEAIRPAVQADGGDIIFHGIDDRGVVTVELVGACVSCPASTWSSKRPDVPLPATVRGARWNAAFDACWSRRFARALMQRSSWVCTTRTCHARRV